MMFENNLQRELRKRVKRRISLPITMILIISGIMLMPRYAFADGVESCPEVTTVIEVGEFYVSYKTGAISGGAGDDDIKNGECGLAVWFSDPSVSDIEVNTSTSNGGYNYWSPTGLPPIDECWVSDGGAWATTDCVNLSPNRNRSLDKGQDPQVEELGRTDIAPMQTPPVGVTYQGALWSFFNLKENEVIYGITADSEATLTFSGATTVSVGTPITFTASWSTQPFSPRYVYFFESVEDTFAIREVDNFPLNTTDSWTFNHTYAYAGQYLPFVVVGSVGCDTVTGTGQVTGSGCTTFSALATGLTVETVEETSDDIVFPSTLTGSKLDDILVGELVDFTYDINDPCTITEKRFFLGYSDTIAFLDSGAVLPAPSLGTHEVIFPRTNQPYSDYFFPYVELSCSDFSTRRLYVGGSWDKGNARGVSVYTQVELDRRDVVVIPMLNGGSTIDFGEGIGVLFRSNKNTYDRLEIVYFELNYFTTFAPIQALFFPNIDEPAFLLGDDGLNRGIKIRFTHFYETSGFKDPRVVIFGAGGGQEDTFYLGGEDFVNPYYQLYITRSVWNSFAGLFDTSDGIFGLDPTTFTISFISSQNAFLVDVNEGLNKIMFAGLKVAGVAYNLLKNSPILSFFTGIIHPPQGSTYIFPTGIGGFEIPRRPSTLLYTVNYASPSSGFAAIGEFIKVLVGIGFMFFIFRKFLLPKW